MTTIHMETERVRATARQLDQWAASLLSSGAALRSTSGRLSIAWQGRNAESFNGGFRNWLRDFEAQAQQLQNLALRMSREVDEWESTDGNNAFQEIKKLLPAAAFLPGLSDSLLGGGGGANQFDWKKWGNDAASDGLDVLKGISKRAHYKDYQNLGRAINKFFKDPQGGNIKKLNDFGHFVKNPLISNWGMPIAFSSFFGVLEGKGLEKSLISGVAQAAIKNGLEYAIPGFGTVMLISSGVQLAGHLIAGGAEALGYHDFATGLENGLDVIDLGGYVEKISDGIADYVMHPDRIGPDLQSAWKSAQDFACGTGNSIGQWLAPAVYPIPSIILE